MIASDLSRYLISVSSVSRFKTALCNLLPLMRFKFVVCWSVAYSIVSAKTPTKTLDLSVLNVSRVYNATPMSNVSDVLALPTPLPYGFSVPNTQTYIRLGFGLPRHRLDPMSLTGLIAVVQHAIVEGIHFDGEDAYPDLNIFYGKQRFQWTLGDGFTFLVWNSKSGNYFTWEQLKHLVEGLKLYLVDGDRYYSVAFNFWDGPGWWRMPPLGHGGFMLDTNEE